MTNRHIFIWSVPKGKVTERANNFAVSTTDISVALPKVSATLSQAGNTLEESIALLTGAAEVMPGNASRIARGLRSVTLNLQGMTDEGEQSIELMAKMEKDFNKLGITLMGTDGQLKSTFDILSELAQVYPTLDKNTQTYYSALIGGKTQVDIVNSLLTNFNNVLAANETGLNSAGSAVKENEKVLQSLEGRLQLLRAEFEELANKTLSSDFLKSLIDVGTLLLKFANSDIGQAIIKTTLLTTGIFALSVAYTSLSGSIKTAAAAQLLKTAGTVESTAANIANLASTLSLSQAIRVLTASMMTNPLFWVATGGLAIFGIIKAFDSFNVTLEESINKIDELSQEYDTANNKALEYSEKIKKNEEEILSIRQQYGDNSRVTLLEAENAQLEIQKQLEIDIAETRKERIAKEAKDALNKKVDTYTSDGQRGGKGTPYKNQIEYAKALLETDIANGKVSESTLTLIQNVINLTENLDKNDISNAELIKSSEELQNKYLEASNSINNFSNEVEKSFGNIAEISHTYASIMDDLESSLSDVLDAQSELEKSGKLSFDTVKKLISVYPDLEKELKITKDGYILSDNALQNLIDTKLADYKLTIEESKKAAIEAYNSQVIEKIGYEETTDSILSLLKARAELLKSSFTKDFANREDSESLRHDLDIYDKQLSDIENSIKNIEGAKKSYENALSTLDALKNRVSKSSASTSSKSAKQQEDLWKKQFDDWYSLQKHKIEIGELSEEEFINELEKMYKEYFSNLKKYQSEYWKYEEEVYNYRQKLEKERLEKEKKVLQERQKLQKEYLDSQKSAYETAFDYMANQIDKEIDLLERKKEEIEENAQAEIDALNKQNEILEDNLELEQALEALEKAKNKRVLIYKNGMFQYGEDAQEISNSQKELDNIKFKKDLKDRISAIEEARDKEIDAINDKIKAWEIEKEKWASVVSSYTDQQNKLIAEQILGIKLEGDNWKTRLENLQDYVNEYNSILEQLADLEGAINGGGGSGDGGAGPKGSGWSASDMAALAKAGKDWNDANAAGDKAGMEAAHKRAEAIRGKYGYSGGSSGDKYIPNSSGGNSSNKPSSGGSSGSSGSSSKPSQDIPSSKPSQDIRKYASGTLSATGGISEVGENGRELRVLNKGDGIIPNHLTENLMKLGEFSPKQLFSQLKGHASKQTSQTNYNFDNLVLPNVTNGEQFINELKNIKNLAYQRAYQRG